MKTILTLTEKDVYPGNIITPETEYVMHRNAVRVVIFDKENNVALECFNSQEGDLVYCIIGGGIEDGEDVTQALIREAHEEAGVKLQNIQELGIVEERGIGTKEGKRFSQTNYCFIAYIDGEKLASTFTEYELSRGFHCVWLPLEEAISKLRPKATGFMTRRSLFLLEEAKEARGL